MKTLILFSASFLCLLLLPGPVPQEKYTLSGPGDYKVIPGTGNIAYKAFIDGTPYALAASPDGELLAMSSGGDLFIANFSDGSLRFGMDLGNLEEAAFRDGGGRSLGYIRCMAFTPDGKKLAIGLVGGLLLLDMDNGTVLWHTDTHMDPMFQGRSRGTLSSTYEVQATPDGLWLLTTSKDEKTIRFWSVTDGSPGKTIELDIQSDGPDELAISPDGSKIAVGTFHGAMVLDANSGQILWQNQDRVDGDLSFSPDSKLLAGGGDSRIGYGAWVEDMDPESSADLLMAPDGNDYLRGTLGAVWSPDGQYVFMYPGKGGVVQSQVSNMDAPGKLLVADCEPDVDSNTALVISPDGKLLAVADKEEDQIIVVRL